MFLSCANLSWPMHLSCRTPLLIFSSNVRKRIYLGINFSLCIVRVRTFTNCFLFGDWEKKTSVKTFSIALTSKCFSIFMACQLETTEYSTEGCIIKSVLTKVLRKPPIGFCKNLFFGQVSNESDLGSCN